MQHLTTPPGPKDKGFLRSFLNSVSFSRAPLEHLVRYSQEYGDIVRFRLAKYTVYQINKPEYIGHIFNSTDLFRKETVTPQSRRIRGVFGSGLLTSEGDAWSHQRMLSESGFSAAQIALYSETIVASAKQMMESWQDGETREVYQDLRLLNRDIVAKIFLGPDQPECGKELSNILERLADHANTPTGIFSLPEKIPTPGNIAFKRALRRLDEILYPIIERRRKSGGKGSDLLAALLEASDEDGNHLNDKELRDAFINFFIPARENVAMSLAWAWYLISLHPEVEERIHAEVDLVLGGRQPGMQDVPLLPYITQVIMEVLRLYPPVWRIARQSSQDSEIGGVCIPNGSLILMSQWVVHHSPQYFIEPDRFDPNRWDRERIQSLPKYAYFPFGGGERICIGRNVAMSHAILLLSTIAQAFRFRTALEKKPVLDLGITLRPKHGIHAILEKR